MVEMKSDIARRASFSEASVHARHDTFNYEMHRTMDERLSDLRAKQMKPKKRFPWITVISIVSVVPLFFMGDIMPNGGLSNAAQAIKQKQSPEAQLSQEIQQANAGDVATVTVTMGGKTFTRQLTAAEIQAMQGMQ